jgi:DNA-binding SARP family transcriptional activator
VLRPKAIALVAYLALAESSVTRSELARLLFPDAEAPLATLRWHLAHVRARAPAFIVRALKTTREHVALTVRTDVVLFRAGAQALCRRSSLRGAARVLALYRGDLVAGLTVSAAADFDNWLYVEQESLRRLFRQAVLTFVGGAGPASHSRAAAASVARLVTIDPYCEEAHVSLIRAYDRLGNEEAARASYERYQDIVRRELIAEPQPSLMKRFEGRPRSGRNLPHERLVPLSAVTLHIVEWGGGEPTIVAVPGSAGIAHMFGVRGAPGSVPPHHRGGLARARLQRQAAGGLRPPRTPPRPRRADPVLAATPAGHHGPLRRRSRRNLRRRRL